MAVNSTGIMLVDEVIDAYIYAFGGTLFLSIFVLGVFIYLAMKTDMDRTGLTLGFLLLFAMMTQVMGFPHWPFLLLGVAGAVGVFLFFKRVVF